MNPDDIASISVLEGASAAALYGYEGQNGVILVTTKKGKAGKPEINFNSSAIFSSPTLLPKFQNSYGQSGGKLSWDTSGNKINSYDNLKTFFRTGNNFTNSINFTTGNENAQTYFSYANTKANGIEPTNNLMRHNITLRETGHFFDDKLVLDGSASYITQKINNTPAAGLYFNPLVGLYLFPRGLDIQPYKNNYLNPDSVGFKRQNWVANEDIQQNPWWILNKNPNWGTRNRFIFNGSIRYEANNWLTLQSRGSVDRISDDFELDVYSGTQSTLNSQGNGSLGLSTQTVDQKYADLLATIKINTNSKFKADIIIGTSIKDTKTTGYRIGRGSGTLFPNGPAFTDQGLSITDLFTPSNIISGQANASSNTTAPLNSLVGRTQTQSIFGNVNLSYDNWAYLTFTERTDWSSLLAYTPKSSFSYPSVGLSLVVDQMLKLPEAISYLKVRGSYAEVGNPPSIPYIANILNYESPAGQLQFINAQVIGSLKPENTKSTEFGIDMKLFKRLNIAFTYYNTKTINQLFQVSPSVTSLISTAFVNAGEIKNVGQELSIGYNVFQNQKFTWTSNIVASHNKNTVVKVDPEHGLDTYTISGGGGNTFESRLVKGGSAGDIYGYGFIRDDQGRIEISSGKPTFNS
ncbi:MAG: SusC/RagA family TonB-linked outer membrane protein, partial [Pseudopedobacter saltans]